MIERQVVVTWYKPEEKLPPEGRIVIATVSGHRHNRRVTYDHALALASWFNDGCGWELKHDHLDSFTVLAWCDLDAYGLAEG